MSNLAGKRALVTGGSRGIGAAIALALAEQGADVAIGYERSADLAEAVIAKVEAAGRQGVAIQADSADPAAIAHLVETATASLGGLDIVVNNAGIARGGPVADMSLEDIDALRSTSAPRSCSQRPRSRISARAAGSSSSARRSPTASWRPASPSIRRPSRRRFR